MEVKGESSLRGSERRPRPTQKVQKEQQTGEIRFLCSCGSYRHRAFSTNGAQEKGGFTSKVDFHFFFYQSHDLMHYYSCGICAWNVKSKVQILQRFFLKNLSFETLRMNIVQSFEKLGKVGWGYFCKF